MFWFKAISYIVTNVLVAGSVLLLSIYSIQPIMVEGYVATSMDLLQAIGLWILFWVAVDIHVWAKNYEPKG